MLKLSIQEENICREAGLQTMIAVIGCKIKEFYKDYDFKWSKVNDGYCGRFVVGWRKKITIWVRGNDFYNLENKVEIIVTDFLLWEPIKGTLQNSDKVGLEYCNLEVCLAYGENYNNSNKFGIIDKIKNGFREADSQPLWKQSVILVAGVVVVLAFLLWTILPGLVLIIVPKFKDIGPVATTIIGMFGLLWFLVWSYVGCSVTGCLDDDVGM